MHRDPHHHFCMLLHNNVHAKPHAQQHSRRILPAFCSHALNYIATVHPSTVAARLHECVQEGGGLVHGWVRVGHQPEQGVKRCREVRLQEVLPSHLPAGKKSGVFCAADSGSPVRREEKEQSGVHMCPDAQHSAACRTGLEASCCYPVLEPPSPCT